MVIPGDGKDLVSCTARRTVIESMEKRVIPGDGKELVIRDETESVIEITSDTRLKNIESRTIATVKRHELSSRRLGS